MSDDMRRLIDLANGEIEQEKSVSKTLMEDGSPAKNFSRWALTEKKAQPPRKYWTLAERGEDGKWAIAFGDYERRVVQDEADDMVNSGTKRKNLKIITSDHSRAAVEGAVAALNEGVLDGAPDIVPSPEAHEIGADETSDSFFDIPEDDHQAQVAWMIEHGQSEGQSPAWHLHVEGDMDADTMSKIANEVRAGKRNGDAKSHDQSLTWALSMEQDDAGSMADAVPSEPELDEGVDIDTVTGPAHWASYLVNGDASGLEPHEIEAADRWHASLAPHSVVDTARNEHGEGDEPRFSWNFRLHGGDADGGDVIDYITHAPLRSSTRGLSENRMAYDPEMIVYNTKVSQTDGLPVGRSHKSKKKR